MTAVNSVLIVGAGIGGLTAAIALRQQGIKVDVIEIQPRMMVYGVGIIQPNNMLRALDKIGLAEACVDNGAPYPGWKIYDAAANLLMDAPGSSAAAPNFPPNNGITRPKLHELLTDKALAEGATIRFSLTLDDFEDKGDHVDVRLSNGETGQYDLVLGCDGNYSTLRKRMFPNAQLPKFTGQGVWRYNMPRPAEVEWGALLNGPNSKVGLVPLSPTLMYMLIVSPEPGNPRFDNVDMAAEMRKRLEDFSGFIEPLKAHITTSSEVVYRPLEAHMLDGPWMQGRVLLIGDAVHGTTPHLAQGAAMAIEDGVLLGELLARDEPLPKLLDEFMERRFARSKFVVDTSIRIGELEMLEWAGEHPEEHSGEVLHHAILKLMEDY